jgi:hypothetical protein
VNLAVWNLGPAGQNEQKCDFETTFIFANKKKIEIMVTFGVQRYWLSTADGEKISTPKAKFETINK